MMKGTSDPSLNDETNDSTTDEAEDDTNNDSNGILPGITDDTAGKFRHSRQCLDHPFVNGD